MRAHLWNSSRERLQYYKVHIKGCQFLKYNTDSDNNLLLVYYFVICMSPLLLVYMATMLLIVSCSLGLRWGVKWEK